jgi:YidC/Oxa1 family membrane protein insertase
VGFFEIFSSALAGLYAFIPSYGVAIILLTLVVRVLLLPLSIKQTRSMRETQRIQPEIAKIRAANKGNSQKMNEELMALYKEHGVNPFGGCLPLVMQFPALIGLFYVIRSPLSYMGYRLAEAGQYAPTQVTGILERVQDSSLASGLIERAAAVNQFLPGMRLDCSSSSALAGRGSDSVPTACANGVVGATPYLILVLLMGFTTYYQQKQMQATQVATGTTNQQMQMLTKIMPVMLMFFAFSFPTGVVLYWLTTNVWMIAQQRLMLKAAPPLVAQTSGGGNGAKPSGGSGGKPTSKKAPSRTTGGKDKSSNGGSRPPAASSAPGARSPNASKKKKRR